ncbi:hypothetical protein HYDPIDRAFT_27528 [Hydnomerulius pinastri MD-312]|nr:hypothetical protein HYDPIDRAFT_27528 [Hydnomerulius pinastri MD-312]
MRRDARTPFNTRRADIILRSSDNVYFRVYRCLLAFASPFFDSMFDLPRPHTRSADQELVDNLEVIPVSEGSQILDMLLRFCYPATVDDPKLETTADIEGVLEAAVKYAMEEVEQRVRRTLLDPRFLEKEPLRIFAIAYRFRFESEARAAAICLLRHPTPPNSPSALRYIDHNDLQKLAAYRSKCAQAVQALGSSLTWLQQKQSYGFYKWWTNCCMCPQRADARYLMDGTYAREWWAEYMDETLAALQETPCSSAVIKNVPKALERASDCPSCLKRAQAYVADFTRSFAQEVDRAVAAVPLGIAF